MEEPKLTCSNRQREWRKKNFFRERTWLESFFRGRSKLESCGERKSGSPKKDGWLAEEERRVLETKSALDPMTCPPNVKPYCFCNPAGSN